MRPEAPATAMRCKAGVEEEEEESVTRENLREAPAHAAG
jgi:hypothetical protein